MNLKKVSSLFLLLLTVLSIVSFPIDTYANECIITPNFKSGSIINKVITYTPEKVIDVSFDIAGDCSSKKVQAQIVGLSGDNGGEIGPVDVTKNWVDVPLDDPKSISIKYKIGEEKCVSYSGDSLKSKNIDKVASAAGMTTEELKGVLVERMKSDPVLQTILVYFGSGSYDNSLSEKYGTDLDWYWYRANKLNVDNVQKVLDVAPNILKNTSGGTVLPNGVIHNLLARIGIYDCNYVIKTRISNSDGSGTPVEKKSTSSLKYVCGLEVNEWFSDKHCDEEVKWEAKSGFTPGIRPTVVTESLCLNEDGTTYDENCYEPLAPIPGFGRKLNFSDSSSTDGTQPFTLGTYIGTIIKISIGAASIAAVMFLTYAGIMYMIAGKSGGGALLDQARKRLINVAWGLAVILGSWIILNTINPELLKINPKFEKVTLEAPDSGVFLNKIESKFNGTIPGAPGERRDRGTVTRGTKTTPSGEQQQLLNKVTPSTFVSLKAMGFKMSDSGSDLVDPLLGAKLKVFNNNLIKAGITSGTVSEAWKPTTYIHVSPCHYLGTCIDFNISKADEGSIDKVKQTIKAAVDAKLIPVLEVFSKTEVNMYVSSGINENFVMAAQITGVHFSIYDTINK